MNKIRIIIGLILICGITIPSLFATQTEPIGKNLLNPARFDGESGVGIWTFMPISVEPNQLYTFSMTHRQMLGDVDILIESEHTIYVADNNVLLTDCYEADFHTVCTFETGPNTEGLMFTLMGEDIKMFIDYYGFDSFQLELGAQRTEYQPYEGVFVDSNPPVFQGEGTLITSYESYLPIGDIIGTHITAYDEIDGDLTEEIMIIQDNYSGYEQVVGQYEVHMEVSDYSNNTAWFILHVVVKDEVPPIIEGPDKVVVDVDDALLIDAIILNHFSFFDDYDGVIGAYVVLVDAYTGNETLLGEKSATIEIEDTSGNTTSHSFIIDTVDTVAPVITGPDTLLINMSEAVLFESLLDGFTVSDNHTSPDAMTLYIIEHDIPVNMDVPGHYTMRLETADASGNKTDKWVGVEIYDDIPPVINGPVLLETSYKNVWSHASIRSLFEVSDNYEVVSIDDLIITENTYSEYAAIPGTYRITLSLSDANHTTIHNLYITVIDDVVPIFNFEPRIILELGSTISEEDISVFLSNHHDIMMFDPVEISVEHDHDLNGVGRYFYQVRMTNAENEEKIQTIIVDVIDVPEDKGSINIAIVSAFMTTLTGLTFLTFKFMRRSI